MNYDYKVVNVDPTQAFVKRVLLYTAIFIGTVSVALIVLFILFERYLWLFLPCGLLLLCVITTFLIGKSASAFSYHFSSDSLIIEGRGRKEITLPYRSLSFQRNADDSDFSSDTYLNCAFRKGQIVSKGVLPAEIKDVKPSVFTDGERLYLLIVDDYALTLIKGANDEI